MVAMAMALVVVVVVAQEAPMDLSVWQPLLPVVAMVVMAPSQASLA